MTSIPKAPAFLKNLGAELARGKLTPAQADQIRTAARLLEGGAGITDDQIEKVGKDLKLTGGQRAALRFAFLLERVQPTLGKDWHDAVHGASDALRSLAQLTKTNPKVEAAVNEFIASLHGEDRGKDLPGVGYLGALERDGDLLWLTDGNAGPRHTYSDVKMLARGGNVELSFEGKELVLDVAHGRGFKRIPLQELDVDALAQLREAFALTTPKTTSERTFISKAVAIIDQTASVDMKKLPALDGVRLKSPPAPKIKPHATDPAAFAKVDGEWKVRLAENGKPGDPLALDAIALEQLLDIKDVVQEHHTGVEALKQNGKDLEPAIVELDAAITLAISGRQKSDDAAAAAAEDRLRRALQGLPSTNLEREVFLSLVGAVAPKKTG